MSNQNQVVFTVKINELTFVQLLKQLGFSKIKMTNLFYCNRYHFTVYAKIDGKKKKFEAHAQTDNHARELILRQILTKDDLQTYFEEENISVIPFKSYPRDYKKVIIDSLEYAQWKLRKAQKHLEKVSFMKHFSPIV